MKHGKHKEFRWDRWFHQLGKVYRVIDRDLNSEEPVRRQRALRAKQLYDFCMKLNRTRVDYTIAVKAMKDVIAVLKGKR